MYLKASERFDQKLHVVVDLQDNYQSLLKSIKATNAIIANMVQLELSDRFESVHPLTQSTNIGSAAQALPLDNTDFSQLSSMHTDGETGARVMAEKALFST